MLTARFDAALQYATLVHAGQLRKSTFIPYLAHLLGVASLALEFGANEDEAIAALLHDAVEDAGGAGRLNDIRTRFGETVAAIVDDCTDTDTTPKPPWRERKEAYIRQLPSTSPSGQLVSCCDKLHNARSLLRDLHRQGDAVWGRFNGGRDGTLWYLQTLAAEYQRLGVDSILVDELQRTLAEIERVAQNSATPAK